MKGVTMQDRIIFGIAGMSGLVLAALLFGGRIGFGLFFAGLSFMGAFVLYWVQRRLPQAWDVSKPDIAERAATTQRDLKRFVYVFIGLGVLSLVMAFVF